MTGKDAPLTTRAWRQMFAIPLEYRVVHIVIDWERANFIAAKALWPEVNPQACQFHYAQNVHKRAKRLGENNQEYWVDMVDYLIA